MAGHSKFKNIMHRKGAQDKKRAKMISTLRSVLSANFTEASPDTQKTKN